MIRLVYSEVFYHLAFIMARHKMCFYPYDPDSSNNIVFRVPFPPEYENEFYNSDLVTELIEFPFAHVDEIFYDYSARAFIISMRTS